VAEVIINPSIESSKMNANSKKCGKFQENMLKNREFYDHRDPLNRGQITFLSIVCPKPAGFPRKSSPAKHYDDFILKSFAPQNKSFNTMQTVDRYDRLLSLRLSRCSILCLL